MPRIARTILPGQPHHVTQRGNRRQQTFFRSSDYAAYLAIAAEAFAEARVSVWSYCLMPNHVHIIAVPEDGIGMSKALATTHRRYTWRINQREGWTGFLWQGRYSSFPMDEGHLLRCVRYVALNPVRAGLVKRAVDWPWSSVPAHLTGRPDALLSPGPLADRFGSELAGFFDTEPDPLELQLFRRATVTGRYLKVLPVESS
jgi:putative transposase